MVTMGRSGNKDGLFLIVSIAAVLDKEINFGLKRNLSTGGLVGGKLMRFRYFISYWIIDGLNLNLNSTRLFETINEIKMGSSFRYASSNVSQNKT